MRTLKSYVLPLLAAAVAAALPLAASADIIQLKDGRTLTGTMVRNGNSMVIQTDATATAAAQTITTTPDQIQHVTLTNTLTPAQAADSEWTRTAVLIKKADDLATIISLHQKFLDQYPDQNISAGVRTSLAEYQKLERQQAVKFRGHWMPAAQVDVTLRNWQEQAKPALDLYKAGHVREALDAAKQVFVADPNNPDAAAIAGLAAFRLNNLPAARLYFARMALADPSSPLAENNLGVVAAQQHNFAESLIHYAKALQIAPGNRLLLDNIEEALNVYNEAALDKNSAPYTGLLRQFQQAEVRMEAEMAKKNLYRFGSTWVPKDELARRTATRESIQGAMKALDAKYTAARQAFTTATDQITQATNDYNAALNNVNSLNALVQGSQNGGGNVAAIIAQRDAQMADLQKIRDTKTALEAQRDQITLAFADIYNEADKLKAALVNADGAQFSGIERMMELGEDISPPPPAPLPPPAPRVAIAPPQPQVVPIPVDDNDQNVVAQNYQIIATPFGIPVPQRPPRRHDHNGDDNHGHHGPSGNNPASPSPAPTPGARDPNNAAPQGGPNSPWTNGPASH